MPSGSGAAVFFVAFDSNDEPGLHAWTQFRQQLLAAKGGVTPANEFHADHVGVWRLLASNNREVARSASVYSSFDDAREAVEQLQQRASELEVECFHGPVSASHGWTASLDGVVQMTCSRWYETGPISLDVSSASISSLRTARIIEAPVRARMALRASQRTLPLV